MAGAAVLHTLRVITLALPTLNGSSIQPRACSENNCLRALENQALLASAYSFCNSFLATTVSATATAGIPTYLSNCGPNFVPKLSSACPCFLATVTYQPTSSSSTSTSSSPSSTISSENSSATSSAASSTTSSMTSSAAPGSTCPAPVTVTSTVTMPPDTATSWVSATCPTASISVSISVTTTTETSTVTSVITSTQTIGNHARCAQLLDNPSFEDLPIGWLAAPWDIELVGASNPALLETALDAPIGVDGEVSFYVLANDQEGQTAIRISQGFTPCEQVSSWYSPRLWVRTSEPTAEITFTLNIYSNGLYIPPAPTLLDRSIQIFTSDGAPNQWYPVLFNPLQIPGGPAEFVIDVMWNVANLEFWLDNVTLIQTG